MKIYLSLLALVLVLFCVVPEHDWDSPVDKKGTNYHPPTVVITTDNVTAFINDTVTFVIKTTTGNSDILKNEWSFKGNTVWESLGTLDTVKKQYTKGDVGKFKIFVRTIDLLKIKSQPDTAFVQILLGTPKVKSMKDTIISFDDKITMHAIGSDKNGSIMEYKWSYDNGKNWKSSDELNSIKREFSIKDLGKNVVWVKVVDDDGVTSEADSFLVTVKLFEPTLISKNDTVVSQNSNVKITVDVNDKGFKRVTTIDMYYWDRHADGWEDSTTNSTYYISYPEGGKLNVAWGARDDDMQMVIDTFEIWFNRPPSFLEMVEPEDGSIAVWNSVDKSVCKGSVLLEYRAFDPDSLDDVLSYEVYIGKEISKLEKIYNGSKDEVIASDLDSNTKYFWELRAIDLFGDKIVVNGFFTTSIIDVKAPEITILGNNPETLSIAMPYIESGAKADDNIDGDLTDKIIFSGSVNTLIPGSYTIKYTVKDSSDNSSTEKRIVIVEDYIMLEDFEDGRLYQSTFGQIFDSGDKDSLGYWKLWTDKSEGGSTIFDPDPFETDSAYEKVVKEGIGIDGSKGFHSLVRMWNTMSGYWGLGLYLRDVDTYYDLSELDSLTFMAKNGNKKEIDIMRIEVTYKEIDDLKQENRWGYAGVQIELGSDWQEITLYPSDFKGVKNSPADGHTWDTVKSGVKMILFTNDAEGELGDVDLYIDNVKIHGTFTNPDLIEK